MFHHPVHLTAVFLLLQRLPLIELLLTLTEGNIHLGTAFVVDEHQQGDNRITCLLRSTGQLPNLPFREQ